MNFKDKLEKLIVVCIDHGGYRVLSRSAELFPELGIFFHEMSKATLSELENMKEQTLDNKLLSEFCEVCIKYGEIRNFFRVASDYDRPAWKEKLKNQFKLMKKMEKQLVELYK